MKVQTEAKLPAILGIAPRILVIEARFYDEIADFLLQGVKRKLNQAGASFELITVPGALEIPAVVAMALRAARENPDFLPYDGFVVLGTVIRGETTHYDVVATQSNRALMDIAAREAIAIGNGILTVENEAQALARARPEEMDKGGGAVIACLTMIALRRQFGLSAMSPR